MTLNESTADLSGLFWIGLLQLLGNTIYEEATTVFIVNSLDQSGVHIQLQEFPGISP